MNAIIKFRVLFILFLSVLAGCGIIDMEWNVNEYLYGKPRYQELTIRYHYLGWDSKRERFFFIKALTEYRDFKWEAEESSYEWHWYPEATSVRYIVCAVSEDGTNLEELYALPQNQLGRVESRLDGLIQRLKNSSSVLSDGSIIQLIGDNLVRISARGVEELAKVSAGVRPQIEAGPSDKNVLIVSGFNKDRSEDGMYIANLKTGSLDHFPIPEIIAARWSPDGNKVVIIAGNIGISPAVRRIEVFDLLQKSRKSIFEVKLPGVDGPTFEWTRDNTIWLPIWDTKKPEILSDIYTVKETPEFWESNIGEKKYFTGQPVKELRQISLGVMDYQPVYVARMGPPRVFGLVTEWPYGANAVRILRVKQKEQEEKAVSEYETIFLLSNRKIHVSEKQSWDDALKAESGSSEALW